MATAKALRNHKCPLRIKGEVVYIDAMRFCSSIKTEEPHAINKEMFFLLALWIEPGASHVICMQSTTEHYPKSLTKFPKLILNSL